MPQVLVLAAYAKQPERHRVEHVTPELTSMPYKATMRHRNLR